VEWNPRGTEFQVKFYDPNHFDRKEHAAGLLRKYEVIAYGPFGSKIITTGDARMLTPGEVEIPVYKASDVPQETTEIGIRIIVADANREVSSEVVRGQFIAPQKRASLQEAPMIIREMFWKPFMGIRHSPLSNTSKIINQDA